MKTFHVTAKRNGQSVHGWTYVAVEAKSARKAAALVFDPSSPWFFNLPWSSVLQVVHNSRDRTDSSIRYFAWDLAERVIVPADPLDFSEREVANVG